MKVDSNGAVTIVRKVKKSGRPKGTMRKDNLEQAFNKGRGNVMILSGKTK